METDSNSCEITQMYSYCLSRKDSSNQTTPTRFWKWFLETDFVSTSFQIIARGNFGEVRKAQFRDAIALFSKEKPAIYGDQWAALKYPLSSKSEFVQQFNDLSHEVSCTVILHPNLVNYIGGLYLGDGTIQNGYRAGIVMEFVDTNLRTAVQEDERLKDTSNRFTIAKQIASAMNFLHSLNPFILHRDLRTPNILITKNLECKIADFGISNNLSYGNLHHGELYTALIPPECVQGAPFSKKGDVFFFGWILVELVLGRPKEDYRVQDVMEPLARKLSDDPLKEKYKEMILKCFKSDPTERSSFLDVCNFVNETLNTRLDIEWFALTKQRLSSLSKEEQDKLLQSTDPLHRKLAHQYCIYGNLSSLKELVAMHGRDCLDGVDKYNTNCAHFAARSGYIEILRFLHENGFSKFNEKEKRLETTALSLSIAMKHSSCVEFLTAFADRDALINGLLSGCQEGNLAYVKMFVERGANLQCHDPDLTMTPLAWSARSGHLQTVKFLVERGAKINQGRIDNGFTPLFIASCNGHLDVVSYLVEKGADVNVPRFDDGATPLYMAAQYNHKEIVELLLKNGANPDKECTDDGSTPIYISSLKGHKEIVEVLIKHNADVNKSCTEDGSTPLSISCSKQYNEVIRLLVEHGAKLNGKRNDGLTPLAICCQNGMNDMAEFLLQKGANNDSPELLFFAINNNNTPLVDLLLKYGLAPDISVNGESALRRASMLGHTSIVSALLRHDAQPDSRTIELVQKRGNKQILEILQNHISQAKKKVKC